MVHEDNALKIMTVFFSLQQYAWHWVDFVTRNISSSAALELNG